MGSIGRCERSEKMGSNNVKLIQQGIKSCASQDSGSTTIDVPANPPSKEECKALYRRFKNSPNLQCMKTVFVNFLESCVHILTLSREVTAGDVEVAAFQVGLSIRQCRTM